MRPDVSGVDVDHGDLAGLVEPRLLLLLLQQLISKQRCSTKYNKMHHHLICSCPIPETIIQYFTLFGNQSIITDTNMIKSGCQDVGCKAACRCMATIGGLKKPEIFGLEASAALTLYLTFQRVKTVCCQAAFTVRHLLM